MKMKRKKYSELFYHIFFTCFWCMYALSVDLDGFCIIKTKCRDF